MKKLALIAGLLLAASPVAAQQAQQPLGAAGQTNNSTLTNTGVICIEAMTATFCNVPTPRTLMAMVQGALLDQVRHRALALGLGDRPHWQRRAVGGYSDLRRISAAQRVVQLTKGVGRGARGQLWPLSSGRAPRLRVYGAARQAV
jgi:hypothetical protein